MIKEWGKKGKEILRHPFIWIGMGLLPCMLVLFFQMSAQRHLSRQIGEAKYLKKRHTAAQKRVHLEERLRGQMAKAQTDYLENTVEKMQFLQTEIKKTSAIFRSGPYSKEAEQRLDFLENGQNALRFRQQHFQRVGDLQEMEAIQVHPVEMDRRDLKQLLANLENISIGDTQPHGHPPYLLIKQFELIKKPLPSDEEVFLVNLQLIKRETIRD